MSKIISLTQGEETIVDDADFEWLSQFKWRRFNRGRTGYARGLVNGKRQCMHRLILKRHYPNLPDAFMTDHINGNGLDNRRANLRPCTNRENQRNSFKRKGTSSKYKGVSWEVSKQKWRVQIRRGNNGPRYVGYFKDEKEAARAYNVAARESFGEFARLNEIEELA